MPQTVFLMDASIVENIALGVSAEHIDHERLHSAAKHAQLEEFIKTLPDGYGHLLGERGMRLSGGQRQRIGIARALYTKASVLILDEATNALDGFTEQELMMTLLALRGRYTVILIAHRLNSVRACDRVFQLESGKIIGARHVQRALQRLGILSPPGQSLKRRRRSKFAVS